jgi:hypothetical protein
MDASKRSGLNWVDYALVDKARTKRNEIAHNRIWMDQADCWNYLDAIEAELRSWKIVV